MRLKHIGRMSRLALIVAMIVFLVFDTSMAGCFRRYLNRRQCDPAPDCCVVTVCCPPVDCCVSSSYVPHPVIEYAVPTSSCCGEVIIDRGHVEPSADHVHHDDVDIAPEPTPADADTNVAEGDVTPESADDAFEELDADDDLTGPEEVIATEDEATTEDIEPPAGDDLGDDIFSDTTPADADSDIFSDTTPADADSDIFSEEPAADTTTEDDIFSEEPDAAADDDIFTEEPTTIVPEDDATPAADDDIFGGEDDAITPDDAAAPPEADIFAPPEEDPSIDDIFDSTDAGITDASERVADAGDEWSNDSDADAAPVEDNIDDLFGEGDSSDDDIDSLFDGAKLERNSTGFREVKPVSARRSGDLPFRLWTDNTGNYRTVGRLVQITGTHVRMFKDNGRFSTVSKTRLSKDDLRYVQEMEASLGVRESFDTIALR